MARGTNRKSITAGYVVGLSLGKYGFVGGGLVALLCMQAMAGPEGEHVAAGSAAFARNGNSTVIQAANNTIIDYRAFNIASSESVRFIQPSAVSRVLNRIAGPDPTRIDGSLTANGLVYFANPAGIYFGHGALVNVGGIYAAAGQITNSDFLNNINHFTNLSGSVVNEGTMQAGLVGLVGKHVANSGTILSEGWGGGGTSGMVAMAAGDDVYIGQTRGHMYVRIDGAAASPQAPDAAPAQPGVENTGSITAAGGNGGGVSLMAGDLYAMAIHNTGQIKARDIHVEGTGSGIVSVSGSLDASSQAPGTAGGTVQVLGDKVGLFGAHIDASGAGGGGTVLVGGDAHGAGEARNASQTIVSADSTINADATASGDGGKVVVWSDRLTRYFGSISARGGAESGDGGWVETSGKEFLNFGGSVNVKAPSGRDGSILLDPMDIVIQAAAGGDDGQVSDNIVNFADGGAVTFTIGQAALNALSGNITLQATNTIMVQAGATLTLTGVTGGSALLLEAGNDITVAGSITTGGGNIDISIDNNGLSLNNNAVLSITGTLNAAGGNIHLVNLATNPASGISLSGTLTAGAGNVRIQAGDDITQTAGSITANVLGVQAGDNILLTAGATNNVTTFAGLTTANNKSISFHDSNGYDAGSAPLDGTFPLITGLSTSATDVDVLLSSGGPITLSQDVTANGGTVRIVSGAGVTQTAGKIIANALGVRANGAIAVNSTTNDVATLAMEDALLGAAASYTDANAFTVASVIANGPFALTTGVTTSNGNIGLSIDGTGTTLTATEAINAGAAAATLTCDDIALSGSGVVTGNGGVTLQPTDPARTIGIAGGAGSFALSQAELTTQLASTGTVTIGRANGSGLVTAAALDVTGEGYNLVIRGGSIAAAALTTDHNLTLSAQTLGTGTITTVGAITANGSSSVTLTADDMTIGSTVTANGGITLQPADPARPIFIAGVGVGLQLSQTELTNLSSTGTVTVGAANGSGLVTASVLDVTGEAYDLVIQGGSITTAGILSDHNLTLNALTPTTGTITISGAIVANGTSSVTMTADDMTIGSLVTANGGITLQPTTASRTIGIAGGAGGLALSQAELLNLFSTGTVTVGAANGSGLVTINSLDLSTASYTDFVVRGGSITSADVIMPAASSLTYAVGANGSAGTLNANGAISGATTITFKGAAGDDVFNIKATAAGTTTTVNGLGGNDTLNVGDATPSLDNILGNITFNGGAGAADALVLNDTLDATANTYTITSTTATRGGIGTITYAGDVESLTLNAGTNNDAINITSSAAATPLTINAGAGNDTITVGGGNLDAIAGTVTVDGGGGATDSVVLDDSANASVHTYTVTSAGGSRPGSAAVTFSNVEAFTLDTGTNNNTIIVQSASIPTTINAGAGNDTISVDSNGATAGGTVNNITAALTINGGAGTNTLTLTDTDDTGHTPDTLTLTATTVGAGGGDSFFGAGGSLTYSGINSLTINGGSVLTIPTGAVLGANTIISTDSVLDFNVNFSGTVDGAFSLSAAAGTANVSFGGNVGTGTPLSSLAASGNTVTLNGNITTNGAVDLRTGVTAVSLTNNVAIDNTGGTNNAIALADTTGNFTLALSTDVGSALTLDGADVDTLTFTRNGVVAGGTLTLNGDVETDTALNFSNVGAISLGAPVNIIARDDALVPKNITTDATNTITGNVSALTFNGDTVTLFQIGDGTLAGNPNSLTITAATTVNLNAAVSIDGMIVLQPASGLTTIGLNDAMGTFSLTAAELGFLSTTSTVTIGTSSGTGAISIGSLGAIDLGPSGSNRLYSLTLRGGTVTFSNGLTLGDNTTIRFDTDAITSAPAGTDITIGGATGSAIFNTSGAVGAAVNPVSTSIAQLAAATSAGGVFVSDAGGLTVTTLGGVPGVSAGSGDIALSAGTGNFSNTAAVNAGSSSVNITADSVTSIGAAITGNGGITLQPATGTQTIGLNDASGLLNLSAAELGFLNSTGIVTIGASGGSGAATIGSLGAIDLSAKAFGLDLRAGAVTFINGVTLASDKTFRLDTGAITSAPAGVDITIGGATGSVIFNTSGAVGAAGNPLSTAVAQLAAITTAGGVFISDIGGLDLTTLGGVVGVTAGSGDVRINTNNSALTASSAVTAASGNITLNAGTGNFSSAAAVNAGAGSVTITADTITDVGAAVTGNGGITLQPATATQTIGLNDASGLFNLSATELGFLNSTGTVTVGAVGGSGAVAIGSAGAIDLGPSGANRTYSLDVHGGAVTFNNGITLGDNTTARFDTGAITSAPAGTDITIGGATGSAVFNTTGAVGTLANPVSTAVARLAAVTTTGGVFISDTGGLDITTVGVTGVTAGSGDVNVNSNNGNLSVSSALAATSGNIILNAGTGAFSSTATVNAGAGSVTVTADTVTDIGGAVTGNGGITLQPVTATQTIGLNDASGLFNLSATELGFLNSTGTVTLGASGGSGAAGIGSLGAIDLSAKAFNVTLRAGAVTFANGVTLSADRTFRFDTGAITSAPAGNDLTIGGTLGAAIFNTSGAVGTLANPVATALERVAANATSGPGGGVFISNAGGLTITTLGGVSGVTSASGQDINVQTASPLTVSAPVAASGAGSVTLRAGGGNSGNLAINDNVFSASGAINLRADNNIALNTGGGVTSATGNVAMVADFDNANTGGPGTGGAVTMADGTLVSSGGTITVSADGGIAISRLVTTNATGAAVSVTTANGNITDAGDTGGADADATASGAGVILTATNGSIGSGNAIETATGVLTANGKTGVNIANTGAALAATLLADMGAATLTTTGSLATNGTPWAANSFAATATGAISVNDNITSDGAAGTSLTSSGGSLSVGASRTISTGGSPLNITATDLGLAGSLTSGAGATTIARSTPGTLTVGANASPGDMDISNAELTAITAGLLNLGGANTTGITVDTVTPAASNSIGTVAMTTPGAITFNGPSTFNALTAAANNGITINGALATDVGDMNLDGNADNDADAADRITIAAGISPPTLNAAGAMTLAASTGGIHGLGDLTLMSGGPMNINSAITVAGQLSMSAGAGITFNGLDAGTTLTASANDGLTLNSLTHTNGDTVLNADADANGVGLLTINGGATITTGINTLTLTAADIALNGSIDASGGTVRINRSTGGSIRIGDGTNPGGMSISRAEFNSITAANVVVGNAFTTNVTVDNITAGDSDQITGTVTLNATAPTGTLDFATTSTFNALAASAGDGITVNGNLTTVLGGIALNGDSDATPATNDRVTLGGNINVASAGPLSISAASGGIRLAGATGTTNVLFAAGDGDVTLGAVTATASPSLTVNSQGGITLASANIGGGALALHVDTNNNSPAVAGNFGPLAAGSVAIDGAGGDDTFTLNGPTITASSGPIAISTGSITLANDLALNSSAGGGSVTVAGNVNGAHLLTVTAGTGDVTFTGNIGNATPVTGFTVNSANVIDLNGTVTTGATGVNLTSIGPLTLHTAFVTASGGGVTVNNAGALTITPAASFNLAGGFNQTGGGAVSLGTSITAGGAIAFAAPTTLTADDVLFGSSITLSNTVNSDAIGTPRALVLNSPGTTIFGAAVGAGVPLASLTTDAPGSTSLAANVTTAAGGIALNDAVVLAGSAVLSDSAGGITLGSTVNGTAAGAQALTLNAGTGDATITGAAGGVMPLASLIANGKNVSVNAVTTQGGGITLQPDATLIADATLTSIPGTVPLRPVGELTISGNLTTMGSGGISLSNTGRTTVPGVATIRSLTGTEIVINSAGSVTMGQNEKWTVVGSLTINASGQTVTLGDVSVLSANSGLGNLTVTADNIVLLRRAAGIVADLDDATLAVSFPVNPDKGTDYVASGFINFLVPGGDFANRVTLGGTGTTQDKVLIADRDGAGGATPNDPRFTVLNSKPLQEGFVTLSPATTFDLFAEGTSGTNPASSLAGAIPRESTVGTIAQDTTVGRAQLEQLRQLYINGRELTTPEWLEALLGRSLYNDYPNTADPQPQDYKVAVNRLRAAVVTDLLAAYDQLFYIDELDPQTGQPVVDPQTGIVKRSLRTDEIKDRLTTAVAAYRQSAPAGEIDAAKLREFISSDPDQAIAWSYVTQLQGIVEKMDLLGLSPSEFKIAKGGVLNDAKPRTISAPTFEALVVPPPAPAPTPAPQQ